MSLDRKSAHAALTTAAPVSRQDFEVLAHDIVDNLCDVIDSIAKLAAAQELQYHRHARGLGVGSWEGIAGPSKAAPPSNETEAEKLQQRQVAALEQIAYALSNAKGIQ